MNYTYRFYCFESFTAFAAAWIEAGYPVDGTGAPYLTYGAVDVVGVVTLPPEGEDEEPTVLPGWHVNVAWAGRPADALEAYAIPFFDGLRAFAGWDDQPPEPVPSEIDNSQARVVLMRHGYFDAVDSAVKDLGGEALAIWEYANKVNRYNSPLVTAIAAGCGLTDEHLDMMFREAATISG